MNSVVLTALWAAEASPAPTKQGCRLPRPLPCSHRYSLIQSLSLAVSCNRNHSIHVFLHLAFLHRAYLCFVFNEVSEPGEDFVIGDGWGKGKAACGVKHQDLLWAGRTGLRASHTLYAATSHLHPHQDPKACWAPSLNKFVAHEILACGISEMGFCVCVWPRVANEVTHEAGFGVN